MNEKILEALRALVGSSSNALALLEGNTSPQAMDAKWELEIDIAVAQKVLDLCSVDEEG